MSKVCAKCTKAVYPLEELKCLDKVWHKGCFRCHECNMTLNMKNYKGYEKIPYCSAHYPKTKATVVADTPEMQRLTKNTEIQSQIKYHEEFEKKIKGSKIQVSDDPETQRMKQMNSLVSQVEYKGMKEKTGIQENRRQSLPQPQTSEKTEKWSFTTNTVHSDDPKSPLSDRSVAHSFRYTAEGKVHVEAPRVRRIGSIADYDPVNDNYGSLTQGYNPATRQQSQEWEETVPLSPPIALPTVSKTIKEEEKNEEPKDENKSKNHISENDRRPVEEEDEGGRPVDEKEETEEEEEGEIVNDVDVVHMEKPTNGLGGDFPENEESMIGRETSKEGGMREGGVRETGDAGEGKEHDDDGNNQDEDDMTEQRSHLKSHEETVQLISKEQDAEGENSVHLSRPEKEENEEIRNEKGKLLIDDEERQETTNEETKDLDSTTPLKGTFVALYDYDAQDDDEATFAEGDHIIDCERIDDGWVIGTVKKTGLRGMLPANYIEQLL